MKIKRAWDVAGATVLPDLNMAAEFQLQLMRGDAQSDA